MTNETPQPQSAVVIGMRIKDSAGQSWYAEEIEADLDAFERDVRAEAAVEIERLNLEIETLKAGATKIIETYDAEIAKHFLGAAAPSTGEPAAFVPTHRHFKGGLYQVLHEATWEFDAQPVVVYKGEDGRVWARYASVFNGKAKVDEAWVKRFVPVGVSVAPAVKETPNDGI